jgi:hypothetical protein
VNIVAARSFCLRVFPAGTPEAVVFEWFFERLARLRRQFDSITVATVAVQLQMQNDTVGKKAVAHALDFLADGPLALLERKYLLWADGSDLDVLEVPVRELSDAEVKQALGSGVLRLEDEGIEVQDFLDKVSVVYEVSPAAHAIADSIEGVQW